MTLIRYAALFLVLACRCSAASVHHSQQQELRASRSEARSSFPRANLTAVELMSLANSCKCSFHGVCSCEQAMEFMNCIADACDSGSCACESHHFMSACQAMGTTCPKSGLVCAAGKASCSGMISVEAESLADIIGDLEELRQRKCKLEDSVKKGYFNGKLRLEELQPKIDERLIVLKRRTGGKTLNMNCTEKDIAAFESGQKRLLEEAGKAAVPVSPALAPEARNATRTMATKVSPSKPMSAEGTETTMPTRGWNKYYKDNVYNILKANAVYIFLATILALLYNKHRQKEAHFFLPDKQFLRKQNTGFARGNGLFSFYTDPKLCLFSCCCPAIRWADTVDRAKLSSIFKYWSSFFVMLILLVLSDHSWGVAYLGAVVMGVAFRQRLRSKYLIEHRSGKTIFQDFLAWFCCMPCAIAQEAREEAHDSIHSFIP